MMLGTKTVAGVVEVFNKAITSLERIETASQERVDHHSNKVVEATYERDDARSWLKGLRALKGEAG